MGGGCGEALRWVLEAVHARRAHDQDADRPASIGRYLRAGQLDRALGAALALVAECRCVRANRLPVSLVVGPAIGEELPKRIPGAQVRPRPAAQTVQRLSVLKSAGRAYREQLAPP